MTKNSQTSKSKIEEAEGHGHTRRALVNTSQLGLVPTACQSLSQQVVKLFLSWK